MIWRFACTLWWALTASLVLCLSAPSEAVGAPKVTTRLSPRKIEAGQRVTLSMTITSEDGPLALGKPTFTPPAGALVEGPSQNSSTFKRTVNGTTTERHTTRISYNVIFTQPGKYTLPSPKISADGEVLSGADQKLEVEPASGPTGPFGVGRPGQLVNPFGPFADLGLEEDEDDLSSTNQELALPDGPDDPIFLHARVDKQKVVIGEQVTLSVYLYYRVAYEMTERSEPKFSDFLRFPMLVDPSSATPEITRVKNRRYGARLVERVALVPLRSGKLPTGSLSARFNGRQIGSRVLKKSNELEIEVVEPPTEGRPADYVLGDTGEFSLSATIAPRHLVQGASIAVIVRVDGNGNLPSRLSLPKSKATEWLEPRIRESIAVRNGRIGGHRIFEYAVRIRQSGTVDLGSIRLVSFDPRGNNFIESEVKLGELTVDEAPPSALEIDLQKTGPANEDLLAKLPALRGSLGAAGRSKPPLLSEATLLLGLLLAPFSALLILAGRALLSRVRNRSGAAGAALQTEHKLQLKLARQALKRSEFPQVYQAIARSIHAGIERTTGFVTRGIRISELSARLSEAGVDAQLAEDTAALLKACEEQGFAPQGDGSEAEALLARAEKLGKRLRS